jgi:hypothetical protein
MQPMKIPDIQPGTNGKHEAPHAASGAFHMASVWEAPEREQRLQRRTEFPPDVPGNSLRAFFYNARRHELGGMPLTRWIFVACMALALVWLTGLAPGRWVGVGFWVLAASAVGVSTRLFQRNDFVRFYAGTAPDVTPKAMNPDDKYSAYITGLCVVEGRYARFTMLPGFYRTFATREHALLCLARDRRYLRIGRWTADQICMWYTFFMPADITTIEYGKLQFDRTLHNAIAVTYATTIPAKNKLKRDRQVQETLYIVPGSEEGGRRIWADLLFDGTAATTADLRENVKT